MSPLNPEGKNEREPYVVTSKGHTAVAINAVRQSRRMDKEQTGSREGAEYKDFSTRSGYGS